MTELRARRSCRPVWPALICALVLTTSQIVFAESKDYHDKKFTDADFKDKKLDEANFNDAVFKNGTFEGASLRGATFKDAVLDWVNFTKADLSGANFSGASFPSIMMSMQHANCSKANFEGVNFNGASSYNVNFKGANLKKTSGYKDIRGCDFSGADLRGANLHAIEGAFYWDKAIFKDARYDKTTRWPENFDVEGSHAILSEDKGAPPAPAANYSGKKITGNDFKDLLLDAANFDDAVLKTVSFKGASLLGATFKDAVLDTVNFSKTDLSSANFSGVTFASNMMFMEYVNCSKANFEGVNFNGAHIYNGNFKGANLKKTSGYQDIRGTDFSKADLRGANLHAIEGAFYWDKAIFKGALYDKTTRWPENFDVEASGAKLKEDKDAPVKPADEKK